MGLLAFSRLPFSKGGKSPPRKVIERLMRQANFAHWAEVKAAIEVVAGFSSGARELGVQPRTIVLIE